jgi:hypothetical protein
MQLADKLYTVPPEKFDLWTWRDNCDVEEYLIHGIDSDEHLLDPKCHTTGCAVGWACAMPCFIAEGLHWNAGLDIPEFNNKHSFHAVEAFFDITYSDCTYLFEADAYHEDERGAVDVAKRIERFVKEHSE